MLFYKQYNKDVTRVKPTNNTVHQLVAECAKNTLSSKVADSVEFARFVERVCEKMGAVLSTDGDVQVSSTQDFRDAYAPLLQVVDSDLLVDIVQYTLAEGKVTLQASRRNFLGVPERSVLSTDTFNSRVHPDDLALVRKELSDWQTHPRRNPIVLTYRVRDSLKKYKWVEDRRECIVNEDGVAQYRGLLLNVTTYIARRDYSVAKVQKDIKSTLSQLQNLIIKLYKREDGEYAYSLREGKMAGEKTTDIVFGKSPKEIFDPEVNAYTMPMVSKAFSGESVRFEYSLHGREYVCELEPIVEDGDVVEVVGSMIDTTKLKEVEQELRYNEELVRKIIETIPVGIVQTKLDSGVSSVEYCNKEYARISELPMLAIEDLFSTADTFYLSIHRDDRNMIYEEYEFWKSESSNQPLQLMYRYCAPNGMYKWLDHVVIPIPHNSDRELEQRFLHVVEDISRKIDSEKEMRHLATFPMHDPNPIIEIDSKGNVTYSNPAAQDTFHGISHANYSHPALSKLKEILAGGISQANHVSLEFYIGSECYECLVNYLPEWDVYRIYYYSITERKQAEIELRTALDKEQAIGTMRSRFISTISHEFRTPLQGIITSSSLLKRYHNTMNDVQRGKELVNIQDRVGELVLLIDEFMAQSTISSLKDSYLPVPMDVVALVEKVADELLPKMVDCNQELKRLYKATPIQIVGDTQLLRHAMRNILTNASLYSQSGDAIEIEIKNTESNVMVCIRDFGMGIPESDLEHVCTPFFRATNAGTIHGSGLGLSIARDFIELHKGVLSVSSTEGIGTTVVLSFPIAS